MSRITRFGLIGVLIILVALHLWQIQNVPPGLSNDEANIAYEAWSIATTGRDQWGNFLPIVFEGFGNWSLPIYIYVTAPIVGILGPTILAARLVSALSYILLVTAVYALMSHLRPKIALFAAVLTAATPWIYGLTRVATEAPLALASFLLAINFYVRSRNRNQLIILALIFLILAMLTYYGIWILAVGFALIMALRSRHQIRLSKFSLICGGVVLAIGVWLLWQTTSFQRGNARLSQVNFTSDEALVGELNARRGACGKAFPMIICRVGFNKPLLYMTEYLANYFSHFSLRDWFILPANRGILPPGGYFLLIQLPLAVGGLWALLRQGSKLEKDVLVGWLFLAPLADSLTGPGNFARAFSLAPLVPILSSYSLMLIPTSLKVAVGGLLIVSWTRFMLMYFGYFPLFNSLYTHYEYQPIMTELRGETRPVYISSRYFDTKQYIFYLFYHQIPPLDFQRNPTVVKETDPDRWVWVKQINNWHFVKSLPLVEKLPAESILVGSTKDEIGKFIQNYKMCAGISLSEEKALTYKNGDPGFSIITVSREADLLCPE